MSASAPPICWTLRSWREQWASLDWRAACGARREKVPSPDWRAACAARRDNVLRAMETQRRREVGSLVARRRDGK